MLNVKSGWKNWQLLTEKGRQIWAYKPGSSNINEHLQNVDTISDEEITQFAEGFQFDKSNNPNSGDKVYRHTAINAKFQEFTGQIPRSENPEEQKVTDALIKGISRDEYVAQLDQDLRDIAGILQTVALIRSASQIVRDLISGSGIRWLTTV